MIPRISCPSCGEIQPGKWFEPRRSEARATCYGSRRLGVPNAHGALYTCPTCGWGLQHPMPTDEELHSLYRNLAEDSYLKDAPMRTIQFQRELRDVRSLLDTDHPSLLDFGCSYGLMIEQAARFGLNAVGLELGEDQLRHCLDRGFDVRPGGVECLSPSERFDIVIAWDVLEHVTDPLDTLISLREHTAENGIISLVVPDRGSHIARLLGERWWSILELHLHYPTKQGMVTLLERSGFSVIGMRTHPKLISARLLVEWIPVPILRSLLSLIIPGSLKLTIDPRDQMHIHARAV